MGKRIQVGLIVAISLACGWILAQLQIGQSWAQTSGSPSPGAGNRYEMRKLYLGEVYQAW
jgi:hypothetical protein